MLRKALTIILIGGSVAIAACNTVRGAGEDVQSVANCTENTINNGVC
jgi:predicted small secreted protein